MTFWAQREVTERLVGARKARDVRWREQRGRVAGWSYFLMTHGTRSIEEHAEEMRRFDRTRPGCS